MKEIRLGWSRGEVCQQGQPVTGGLSIRGTPWNRELAVRVCHAGHEVYGRGTL